jgi:hypothetical protein
MVAAKGQLEIIVVVVTNNIRLYFDGVSGALGMRIEGD